MGHSGPAFLTFHRALELQIENSLLAVDPSIEGLPYWSYTPDFETGKPRESEVWTDAFFGSTFGDPEDENMIFDGIGKDWKIHTNASELFQRFPVDSRSTDQSPDIVNPVIMLRGPSNMLAAPHLTRSNTTCGSPNEVIEGAVITANNYSICLATPPEDSGMLPFFSCLDAGAQGPHSFYHHWLGGAWGRGVATKILSHAPRSRGLTLLQTWSPAASNALSIAAMESSAPVGPTKRFAKGAPRGHLCQETDGS
jgi:hypothetical protein